MPADAQTAFFSYSRTDSEFVLRLASDLKASGANVWLDQLDIQPGQRWARAVQDALNNAPCMIVILSPASVSSTNVEDEVTFALEEHKTVVPVFYRDCKVPFQLRPFQYVDFRSDYSQGLKVMLKTLGAKKPDVQRQTHVEVAPKLAVAQAQKVEQPPELTNQKEPSVLLASAPPRSSPAFRTPAKVALGAGVVLLIAIGLYWASHARQPAYPQTGDSSSSPPAATQPDATAAVQPTSPAAAPELFNGTWKSPEDGYLITLNLDGNTLSMKDSLGFYYTAEFDKKAEFHRQKGYSGGTGGLEVDHILVKRNGNVLDVTFFRLGEIVGHQTVTVAPDGKTLAFDGQFIGEKQAREMTMVKQ